MKTQSTTAVQSTIHANAVACEFDSEGTAHLMSILSNMYRDAYDATLREYAANARDSHTEARNPDPIEITLPTAWEPTLVVRDRGIGLSKDGIITVYSRYGKSTKRDTNEQVGAFGIGAKSAFTIATQFTVTGVKDGQKTVALFALNSDGVATVTILSETATDEPNGVTVTISVDDVEAMHRAAERIFSTWEPGSVLVDGEQPHNALADMLRVTDDIYASTTRDSGRSSLSLIMGGIAYPATDAMLRLALRDTSDREVEKVFTRLRNGGRFSIAAKVPLGSVDITPSREDLRDTPRTITMLRKVVEEYVGHIEAAIAHDLDTQPSPMHAAMRLKELSGFLPNLKEKGASWRGKHLPYEVKVTYPSIDLRDGKGRVKRSFLEDDYTFYLGQDVHHILIVTDVAASDVGGVRRLATRYLTNTDDITQLILTPNAEEQIEWVRYGSEGSPLATITCEEFKTAAKAMPTVTTGRGEVIYSTWQDGDHTMLSGPEIKALDTRVVAHRGNRRDFGPLLDMTLDSEDILVMLEGAHTRKALERRVGDVVAARDIVAEKAKEIVAGVTDTEARALEFRRDREMDTLIGIVDRITTEHLRNMITTYRQRKEAAGRVTEDRLAVIRHADVVLGNTRNTADEYDLSDYPLLPLTLTEIACTWRHTEEERRVLLDHAVFYVNTIAQQTTETATYVAA